MIRNLFRSARNRLVSKAVRRRAAKGRFLNARLGLSLLRDRRVPATSKLLALTFGALLTGVLIVLELPLEAFAGLFVPFLGLAADAMIDGVEVLVMPFLLACLLLPHLAPRRIVDMIAL